MGRKPKTIYPDNVKALIVELFKNQYTNDRVAQILGVTVFSLLRAIKANGLTQAIKNAKRGANEEVENALLKRAKGFTFYEKRVVTDHGQIVKTDVIEKYMAPDPISCFFWLCNRERDRWKHVMALGKGGVTERPIMFVIKDAGSNGNGNGKKPAAEKPKALEEATDANILEDHKNEGKESA